MAYNCREGLAGWTECGVLTVSVIGCSFSTTTCADSAQVPFWSFVASCFTVFFIIHECIANAMIDLIILRTHFSAKLLRMCRWWRGCGCRWRQCAFGWCFLCSIISYVFARQLSRFERRWHPLTCQLILDSVHIFVNATAMLQTFCCNFLCKQVMVTLTPLISGTDARVAAWRFCNSAIVSRSSTV